MAETSPDSAVDNRNLIDSSKTGNVFFSTNIQGLNFDLSVLEKDGHVVHGLNPVSFSGLLSDLRFLCPTEKMLELVLNRSRRLTYWKNRFSTLGSLDGRPEVLEICVNYF